MPPILTHRVSGVHGASSAPSLPFHTRHASAPDAEALPAWAQAPMPMPSTSNSAHCAAGASRQRAETWMASSSGEAVLGALQDAGHMRPSAERIAQLIDLLPTYPTADHGRTYTDPALWAEALASVEAHLGTQNPKSPFYGDNTTALVFIMMLMAQQETTEEKRDAIKQLRMYSGMLDALNKLVVGELMPAMQEANRLLAHEKDAARMERIEVKLTFPKDIDTHWAALDSKTGEVTLRMDMGDAPERRETAQGIAQLMTLADQWRTSIQNRQTQHSSRFQAQDNASSATLNIINGVLKVSHEGASNAIRNLSG